MMILKSRLSNSVCFDIFFNYRSPKLYFDYFESHLGWVGMLASSKGIRRTTIPQDSKKKCLELLGAERDSFSQDTDVLLDIKEKLLKYFYGNEVSFNNVLIDIDGASEFSRQTLNVCRSIPFGETRTYRWLAIQVGRPNAFRAVGNVMSKNPLPILIPCHRVIASGGGVGGYASRDARIDIKRSLLDLESSF